MVNSDLELPGKSPDAPENLETSCCRFSSCPAETTASGEAVVHRHAHMRAGSKVTEVPTDGGAGDSGSAFSSFS